MRGAVFAAAWLVAGVVLGAPRAMASPRAELVLLWAPGHPAVVRPVTAAARRVGAAVIDTTPSTAPARADARALRAGRDAYEALRFDDALASLRIAAQSVELTGGAGLSSAELGDLFLYRALSAIQVADPSLAWDDFVRAAAIDPSRLLDPAQFPPRAVEQFERARKHIIGLPQATVRLQALPGCEIAIDGRPIGEPEVRLIRGRHWLVATCPGHRPSQRGFDAADTMDLEAVGPALTTLSDDAALIQARAINARAVLVVTVTGEIALLRRLGIDGREQARRAVHVARDAAPAGIGDELGANVERLLRDDARPSPWYRSRWTWAAAGVVAATAVLLPFVLQADQAPEVVIRPTGVPW